MKPKQSNKGFIFKLLSFQMCCILCAIGFCSCIGYIIEYFNYNHKIYKNIQICNIDLSGQTLEEAKATLQTQVLDTILSNNLSLSFNGSSINLPLQDFYVASNLDEVIEEAINYSTSLSFIEKWNLLRGDESKNFDVHIKFDELAMVDYAENFMKNFDTYPSDADVNVDSNGHITYVSHTAGQTVDSDNLLSRLNTMLADYSTPSLVSRAAVTNDIELAELLVVTNPKVQLEDLQHVNTLVSSYTTNYTPSAANAKNIELAASVINDILLMPGETFSFNDLVGDTTLDKGYVYAPVIVNSRMTQGVGGGICQVSSTLYNAILGIGILPTERRPHSKPSSYVPLGLDSTIDWGNIDLKFENTLDFPIYISSFTKDGQLHINLYSDKSLLNTSYKLSSEIVKVLPSTVEYVKDPSLTAGSTVLSSSGSNGYLVKVTRNTYTDDELTSTEIISWDTYAPVKTIYRVG